MLIKAERNTRVMVNTPTRVLFVLDRTIFLESVCRGVGKSWGRKGEDTKQSSVSTLQTALELSSHTLSLSSSRVAQLQPHSTACCYSPPVSETQPWPGGLPMAAHR